MPMRRSLAAAAVLLAAFAGLAAALNREPDAPRPAAKTTAAPVLPGVQPGGAVLLPNGWSLRPAGRQFLLGDFPVNLALHPDGQFLAVLHAGYGEHEVVVVDLSRSRPRVVSRAAVDQAF